MKIEHRSDGKIEVWSFTADDSSVEAARNSARLVLRLVAEKVVPLHVGIAWDVLRFELIGYNGHTLVYPARLPIVEGKNPRFDCGEVFSEWPTLARVWEEPAEDEVDEDGVRLDEDGWERDVEAANQFVVDAFAAVFEEFAATSKPIVFTSGARIVATLGST